MLNENTPYSGNRFVRFLVTNNPLYLLSALLMVVGCYLVITPFQGLTITVTDILIYLGIINCYEALLIITALYIIIKKNVIRDGVILLLIEGFFLTDVTLFSPVYHIQDITIGMTMSMIVLALNVLKILLIIKLLGILFQGAFYRFVSIGMLFLYLFGNLISYGVRDRFGVDVLLFVTWLIAGLIPLALIGISRKAENENTLLNSFCEKARIIFPLILLGMILIHLLTISWIISGNFYLCFLSTLLISLAVILPEFKSQCKEEKILHQSQYIFLLCSIIITLKFPSNLVLPASEFFPVIISPLRISLTLTALTFVYFYFIHRKKLFLAFSSVLLLCAFMGYEVGIIAKSFGEWFRRIGECMPKTRKQWGIVSIVAAIVVFICGFLVSIRKAKRISSIKEQK